MSLLSLTYNLLIVFLASCVPSYPSNYDKLWVLPSFDHGGGVFHNFMNVIGFLDYCEQNHILNYQVDFENKGHYYEKELGSNWWEYYFEPVEHKSFFVKHLLGFKRTTKIICSTKMAHFVENVEYKMSRQRAHQIIQKYVRLKPDLQEEIEQFFVKYFTGCYVIGVHFRGTDKIHALKGFAKTEATLVSYEEIFHAIDQRIEKSPRKNLRLFIATDSQEFLDRVSSHYPGLVISTPSFRSQDGTPLHYNVKNAPPLYYYHQGKEAVIDCLLLSKCHFLIKTSSNLNFCSSLFNPKLETISLNQKL